MDLNHSSCWESILERVRAHIPTIEDSSSTEDDDEVVTIYQRPAGLSLVVPDDFSLDDDDDDDELQEQSKAVAQTGLEETCSQNPMLDGDKVVEVTTATQRGAQHPDEDIKANACQRSIAEMNEARMDATVKPNVVNTKPDESFPILSFVRLDRWDLDVALQNLKEDRMSLQQHVSVEPVQNRADGDKDRSQKDIMERLVAFCNNQLSKSVSECVGSSNHIRPNPVWDRSSVRIAAEMQWSHRECPTVHIDLRCHDPLIKPGTSPDPPSESPAKHNNHRETPHAEKHNLKVHIGSERGGREMTGKSMLLRKIREMNSNGNKYPSTDPKYSVKGNEANEVKAKVPQPESTCSHESHQPSSNVQSDNGNPKMESPPAALQSKVRKPNQQSDQQGHQVKQRVQLKHLLKQLETHRPTKSVKEKQPAAENTNVLYDFEASHLQSIGTLPAGIEEKGCVLLIVNLSSPGVVRAHGGRNHLHPAATKSHIYNTLVAWFLSLVGPDPGHDGDEAGAKVPFWVAGLQQLWTEDGLALHVLAVARRCYTQRKKVTDIHAPFYSHVRNFLSETSLNLIVEREHLLGPQAFASPVPLPSSSLSCFISATSNKKVIDRTFGLSPGFYWQTVDTQEHVCKGRDTSLELHTEVSVALRCKAFFLQPLITLYTLQLVLDSGLDVCGLRLLYPPQGLVSDSADAIIQRTDDTCQPILALAVRGPHANSVLKHLTSSLDPLLPRKMHSTPLNALHHRSQEPPLFCSPRLASRVHRELCLWFSGRLQGGGAQDHNQPLNRDRGSLNTPPSFLCATTKADLLLVVSPAVPPCCYGQVLAVCERRGFGLRGLQKLRLWSNGAAVLGLTSQQAFVFCRPHTVTSDEEELELPSHCLVLLLRKENALHHSVRLPAALMREFKAEKLLGHVLSRLDGAHTVEPSLCFHTVPYRSNLFHMFVRRMWTVPDPSCVILSHQKWSSNSNVEQVVILTLCGKDMSQGLLLLHRVLTEGPEGEVQHAGFELLSLKCVPALTRLQAQELSPYEVGEQLCRNSVDNLTSSPALVCALRGVDALASLRKLLPQDYPGDFSVLMSPTPEVALRQAYLFFSKHELSPDYRITQPLKLTSSELRPPNSSTKDPQVLLTVCLLKPRVWNHCPAKIFCELKLSDLSLVGLRVVTLDRSSAASLLPADNDPSVLEAHVEYMCSGSSLGLCLEGENAVMRLLDVLSTEGSSLWTTCYGMTHSYNGIYGSGSYERAIQDVKRFFPEGLCCAESSTMRQEQILNMCSDPLASVERERTCTLTPVALESLSSAMAPEPNPGSLIHGALWQTTCLLIPLNAPPLSQASFQLDLLEQLLRSGCRLVAGRTSMLDTEQRKHITEVFNVSAAGKERMAHMSSAPCLIMALQGEMVVTRFNLILESIYKERSDLQTVGKVIIYPESEEEARKLTCYLFDALSPESCHSIEPWNSNVCTRTSSFSKCHTSTVKTGQKKQM